MQKLYDIYDVSLKLTYLQSAEKVKDVYEGEVTNRGLVPGFGINMDNAYLMVLSSVVCSICLIL